MLRIVFAGNNERGLSCLKSVKKHHNIIGIICNKKPNLFLDSVKNMKFEILQPDDVNSPEFIQKLQSFNPDIIVLAGYGSIVKKEFISVAKYGCINLHGGELPKYRGSSPMNWALINGDKSFTLSIIQVDSGIDTGDILIEKKHVIEPEYNISDLHRIANDSFPILLNEVLDKIENNSLIPKAQKNSDSSYYPLRFPDDGFILFDKFNAEEIHNRVRALAPPYPGVTTFFMNRKITIIKTRLTERPFFGEAGRIYQVSKLKGILVCAKDKCLWLEEIIDSNSGNKCMDIFSRYEKFTTINQIAEDYHDN